MGYIDSVYYYGSYGGAETADDIDILIERASEIVNILTGGKIEAAGGIDGFADTFAKEKIQLATGAQVDYLDRNGGLSSLDSSTPVQMTLGKFSYMNGSGTSERNSFPVSSLARGHLEEAGLLIRSISVRY